MIKPKHKTLKRDKQMNTQKLRQAVLFLLGMTAFVTIFVLQPDDNSATWLSDMLVTKTIGFIALFSAVIIASYKPAQHKSNH